MIEAPGLALLMDQPPVSPLARFLRQLERRSDLEQILDMTVFVNPSDLCAIVDCEKRLKRHLHDRSVCLAVFLADLCSDARGRCDDAGIGDKISLCTLEAIRAATSHYEPNSSMGDIVPFALRQLLSTGAVHQVHASFECRFRDWRQMVRAVRRIPNAHTVEDSPQYGEVTPAILVADSVGNMLSHVRHMYCDKAFSDYRISLE
jgi:hypothetical protein